MRSLALFLFTLTVLSLCMVGRAYGSPKRSKPQVCLNYAIAKTTPEHDDAVAICYETKTPKLYYRFEEVTIVDAVEGRRKVLLGWQ